MLTCKETSQLISAQYDRPLDLRERLATYLHLMMCRYCRAVAQQIALIQKWAGLKHDTDLSSAGSACLSAEARDRIAAAIAKMDSSTHAGNPPS